MAAPPLVSGRGRHSHFLSVSQPVSRVLYAGEPAWRPFIWDARCRTPRATNPDGGPKPAWNANVPCHPYSVLLPVGFAVPPLSPGARCALTAPFHPCRASRNGGRGGLLSVALSLELPPPGVTRHRVSVEPGLSSPPAITRQLTERPPGQLTLINMNPYPATSRGRAWRQMP